MADASGPLHAALATVRQTNAAHASAIDALERACTAETALFLWLRLSRIQSCLQKHPSRIHLFIQRKSVCTTHDKFRLSSSATNKPSKTKPTPR